MVGKLFHNLSAKGDKALPQRLFYMWEPLAADQRPIEAMVHGSTPGECQKPAAGSLPMKCAPAQGRRLEFDSLLNWKPVEAYPLAESRKKEPTLWHTQPSVLE